LVVSDAKRLKGLEDKNRRLKKLLAEAMLDRAALKDLLDKTAKAGGATRRRRIDEWGIGGYRRWWNLGIGQDDMLARPETLKARILGSSRDRRRSGRLRAGTEINTEKSEFHGLLLTRRAARPPALTLD
jgi:putative transposase